MFTCAAAGPARRQLTSAQFRRWHLGLAVPCQRAAPDSRLCVTGRAWGSPWSALGDLSYFAALALPAGSPPLGEGATWPSAAMSVAAAILVLGEVPWRH